ncbi:MAG: TonB family protein [Pedobacter sp.]|nr:TonB family protein [Pedobacter sp.]MDQ8051412.1 TonB family protein [Pedobacter sp.]
MLNNSNLYDREWLAVVFSNRNQNYGAYVLRSQSSNMLLKAFAIVAPLFVLLFIGPMLYARLHAADAGPVLIEHEVTLADKIHTLEKQEEKKEQPKKEMPKADPPPQQQQVKTTQFNNVVVVESTNDIPPTTEELNKSVIASVTQDGAPATANALPTGDEYGNGTSIGSPEGTGNEPVDLSGVDQYPEFPGGMEAWGKFIQKNLRYPYAAQDASIQGKVFLSFVVEKDGSITDVHVIKGIGYGCDDEAVRVIKKSPRWKAGMQNKQLVRVRYNIPINYTLSF